VAPVFKRASESRKASFDDTRTRAPELMGKVGEAIVAFTKKHADEMAAKGKAAE
jgi:hypothetical protein